MTADLTTASSTAELTAAAGLADGQHIELSGRRRAESARRLRLRRWVPLLVLSDASAVGVAALSGAVIRFGVMGTGGNAINYRVLALLMVPIWLGMMAFAGAYDARHIAAGSEQYRRVVNGAIWVLALSAFVSFALRADLSREFILVSIPCATVLAVAGRYAVRKALHRQLATDRAAHRVLAVGLTSDVQELITHMRRASFAGFRVIAAMTPAEPARPRLPVDVAWAGTNVEEVVEKSKQLGADTIAIAAPHLLAPGQLRRLSWELEDTAIDLMLAPAITDVAGPRIRTRPLQGLPLLCVEKPQFSGPNRVIKNALDRSLSLAGLLLLAPVMLAVAVAVRASSSGPILYRQERVGINGATFSLLKFRSMRHGAGEEQKRLVEANEHDGPLFKIRRDPRLTAVGGFLRRWSLDELPQLWNVARGDMSLVGPRPPLPSEVERYGLDVHRRLLVKPGITGLWQVSGRADLSWDETVRLDLHYVDNWSIGLDLVLLWKTVACVVRGQGAY